MTSLWKTVEGWVIRPVIALILLGIAGIGWQMIWDPRGPQGPVAMTLLGITLLVGGLVGALLAWFYKWDDE
jgi:CHASE2 domain-containing sensor protein